VKSEAVKVADYEDCQLQRCDAM